MEKCVACGSIEIKKDANIEGYIQDKFYDVFSCSKCKTKWSDPHTVDNIVYDYIYKNSEDTPGYMRYSQYARDVKDYRNPLKFLAKQEHVYYSVVKSLPKKGKILEVGCGLGYFTYALAKSGYDVVGIDVSAEAIDEANTRYGNYFKHKDFFSLSAGEGKYDVILMIELIEHVDNPKRYLEHAKTLLAENGRLIVTTPNRSWYGDNVIWSSDLPPVHLTWFSEDGMKLLADDVGYKSTLVPFTEFNLLYGSILAPNENTKINSPFFKNDGTPLFAKFVHSRMYYLTKGLGIYDLLKRVISIYQKIKEFLLVAFTSRRMSVKRSSCMCVVLEAKNN
jgi:SAM-dependent methyltransferase